MPLAVKETPRISRPGITPGLWNEQGQSVIEYTLILVVTVAILLALANVLFKPFGEFVSSYMGKYTACLLEYGELPSLGAQTPSPVDDDSECNKQYQAATWDAGRPPVNNGGSGGSSEPKKSLPSRRGSESSSRSSGGGGGSSGGGSNMRIGNRPSTGVEGGGRKDGKTIEIALENGGAGGFFRGSNGNRYAIPQNKTSYIAITGLTEAEKKELEKKKEGLGGRIISSESIPRQQKKLAIKPPPVKPYIERDEPFTIGNFIRYLFIAALVLALVVFIGGQAVQMSKSGEK